MATQVKHRRGTNAEILAGVPAIAELWFNTTDNTIHMGDGVTPGGIKHVNVNTLSNYTGFTFETIADVDGNSYLKVGDLVSVENYSSTVQSGRLYFKIVASGTGTADGGKYIDLPTIGLQLEQNLKKVVDVKSYGATGDGSTDDTESIQNALNYSLNVYIPPGVYNVTHLEIKDEQTVKGYSQNQESDTTFRGDSVLNFTDTTGTYTYGIISADETTPLARTTFANLGIYSADGTTYSYLMNLAHPVSMHISNLRIQTNNATTGGLRTFRIVGFTSSWTAFMSDLRIRIPDASTKRSFETDMTDSRAIGCSFTGGTGVFVEASSMWVFDSCRIDRSNGNGLTFRKTSTSKGHLTIVNTQVEENTGPIVINADSNEPFDDDTFALIIQGCQFRNPVSSNDIFLSNSTGNVQYGGVISGNVFSLPKTTVIGFEDDEWKNLSICGNTYAETQADFFETNVTDNSLVTEHFYFNVPNAHLRSNKPAETDSTFTVDFATTGNFSPSYTQRVLKWNRIGNRVFFDMQLQFSSNAYTTAAGAFSIGNLPFTASSPAYLHSVRRTNVNIGGNIDAQPYMPPGDEIFIWMENAAGSGGQASVTNLPASTAFTLWISGSVQVV